MRYLIPIFFMMVMAGCGVKGDPLPPEKPVEMSRGKPTFKRAFKNMTLEPAQEGERDNGEEETDEEERSSQ